MLRVEGTTGKLLWRLPLQHPIIAEPAQTDKWLLVLLKDQGLRLVDLSTGNSPQYVQLPRAVRLSPMVDAADGLIFLTADQSDLVVLDAGQPGQCRQVLHLGHSAGSIAAPVAVLAISSSLRSTVRQAETTIRIIAISKDKEGLPLRPVQTIRLPGYVNAARHSGSRSGCRDRGRRIVLDRNDPSSPLPFHVAASLPVTLRERAAHYSISGGDTFWVADWQLTRYAVNADEQRLVPRATYDLGMRFVRPRQLTAA